jgi:serine/threonine-protein kinase/endoribonuclease IRE1
MYSGFQTPGLAFSDAGDRPDTTTCLMHPYFWEPGRRLGFLQDASDRFEIMCRDPRDPHLVLLENNAIDVVGTDWPSRLDKIFVENLGKFRKYDGRSVQDLLRALRNKVCAHGTSLVRFSDIPFVSETPLPGLT